MRRKRQYQKRTFFHSPFVMAGMFFVTLLAAAGSIDLYKKERMLSAELSKRTAVENERQKAYEEIAAEVTYLESERGKEEAFRTQFDVVRAGEELVIVDVDDDEYGLEESSATVTEATTTDAWYAPIFFWR